MARRTTAAKEPRKARYMKRLGALKAARASWEALWQDCNDYIQPRLARFQKSDTNKGDRKDSKVINSTPSIAGRTLGSGLLAGTSSPSRPWHRVTTPDPSQAEVGAVQIWCHFVEERQRKSMAATNTYLALGQADEELGVFGTSVIFIEEDEERVFRMTVIPLGQYYLECGASGEVDTLYREFVMTCHQMVDKFGYENCSVAVQRAYDLEEFDALFDVIHVVEPRKLRPVDSPLARHKPWASVWFEPADQEDQMLLESGYDEKPFCAPRWHVTAGDVYGRSPGMDMLGDAKQLQALEKRKLQLIDKSTNPPMRAPSRAKDTRCSLLPGDVTFVDTVQGGQQFEPVYTIHPQAIAEVREEIAVVCQRINEAMYSSLFLMLATSDRRDVTAREIEERHEEKTLQLGPVLERLHNELFTPLIERIFGIMARAGLIPPAPEELQGQLLKIEYVSVLAAAQKLTAVVGIERLFGFLGNLAAVVPDALDSANTDKAVREYATSIGVAPDLLRPEDEVAALRDQRAQAAQQAQAQVALQNAGTVAQGAQVLSQTDVQGDNALTRLMNANGITNNPPAPRIAV